LDANGNETLLHNFTGINGDGSLPYAPLLRDDQGNLYGTASSGANVCPGAVAPNQFFCGVVFKLGAAGNETVLYDFTGSANGDGAIPESGLIMDSQGNLYGTTNEGGTGVCTGPVPGCGTVFKLDPSGQETVLYSFTGKNGDGVAPTAGLLMDAQGNLYGTTLAGGVGSCHSSETNGCGTVFKLDPNGKETVLYSFTGNNGDGAYPNGVQLVTDASGNLYGSTLSGGNSTGPANVNAGAGIIFELQPVSLTVTVTPASSSITTAQALSVTVTVSAGSGDPVPTGTVTLSSGSYTSAATALSNGSATINIPAASLATGADALTAGYSGDSNYPATTGSSSVTVTVAPGFSLGGGGSTKSISLNPGATANNTASITVSPTGGFTGSVALTAAITSSPNGAQDLPTLSFGSTSPVTINGTTAETATLTIFTTAPAIAGLADPARSGIRWYNAGGVAVMAFALFFGIPERGRRWRAKLVLLLVLVTLVGGLPACGGSGGGGGGVVGNPGTTPGAYTVTVTATSGNTRTTSTITLTVQ